LVSCSKVEGVEDEGVGIGVGGLMVVVVVVVLERKIIFCLY